MRKGINWDAEAEYAVAHGETVAMVARRLRVSEPATKRAMLRRGVDLVKGATGSKGINWDKEIKTARAAGETNSDIAIRLGVAHSSVTEALRKSRHDWESDPRPLADCLKEWQVTVNDGRAYGARQAGQAALRIGSVNTYDGLLKGRTTPYEATIRRLMTLIDRVAR